MKKSGILAGVVIASLFIGVSIAGTILGNRASMSKEVVDMNGDVREGSNAAYAVAREEFDSSVANDFIESVKNGSSVSKIDKDAFYPFDYDVYEEAVNTVGYDDSTESDIQVEESNNDTVVDDTNESEPLNEEQVEETKDNKVDNSVPFAHSSEDSLNYWIDWEGKNIDDVYYYDDRFMPDMIVGLLSGYIEYCPMLDSVFAKNHQYGIIPENKNVEVLSIDTSSCSAEVKVTFTDNSTKNYDITYSLDSDECLSSFNATEKG